MTQRSRSTNTQRQQTANQVHADYASVENTDGVSFSGGVMMVNGSPQQPVLVDDWESSNGTTKYTTVKWQDPETGEQRVSCNCPGWAIKKAGKPRRCKHTDDMMGLRGCNASKAGSTVIRTISQATERIPDFEGRALRGIMLD
jgi:hypothetical protein